MTVQVPDPAVTVKLTGNLTHHGDVKPSVTLMHTSRIDLTPAAPLSVHDTFRLTGDVQMFFTLMVGEQVFVRKLRARNRVTNAAARGRSERKVLHNNECDIYFNQFDLRDATELAAHRMTMPYTALGERFPQTLLNWFASLPALRPVYEVFFATYRASRMFTESQFLHVVQAAEGFDRRTSGGRYMPDDEYEAVYSALVAAIPAAAPEGLRDKLKKGTLRHANEFSLRKRLTATLKALAADERALICRNAGEFAGAITDTRNNLTHVLGEPPPGDDAVILSNEQLSHATQKLELLLTILMLKHIGIPSHLVVRRVTECGRFDLGPFALDGQN